MDTDFLFSVVRIVLWPYIGAILVLFGIGIYEGLKGRYYESRSFFETGKALALIGAMFCFTAALTLQVPDSVDGTPTCPTPTVAPNETGNESIFPINVSEPFPTCELKWVNTSGVSLLQCGWDV